MPPYLAFWKKQKIWEENKENGEREKEGKVLNYCFIVRPLCSLLLLNGKSYESINCRQTLSIRVGCASKFGMLRFI
jgi:hypothetical protein